MWRHCYWGDESFIHVAPLLLKRQEYYSCGAIFTEETTVLFMWWNCYWGDDIFIHVATLLLLGQQYYSCGDTVTELTTLLLMWRRFVIWFLFFRWRQFYWCDCFTELIKYYYWLDGYVLWSWQQCLLRRNMLLYLENYPLFYFLQPITFNCFPITETKSFFRNLSCFKEKDKKSNILFIFSHYISTLEISYF
jgi:hypothetical protein